MEKKIWAEGWINKKYGKIEKKKKKKKLMMVCGKTDVGENGGEIKNNEKKEVESGGKK